MIRKYKFPYVCNALTKTDTLRAVRDILRGRKHKLRDAFQQETAHFLGVDSDRIFLFGSGRMGVYSLLRSIGVSEEDEVVVAGYTCVVVTNAVKFAGCKVVYCDISEDTLNLDTTQLWDKITLRTRAVVVPHNFGITYEDIDALKRRHPHVIVIEDAAHTFTSLDQEGRKCGTIGDVAFFSMEFSKPISTGVGGIFVINNPAYLEDFKKIYDQTPMVSGWKSFKILLTLSAFSLSLWKRSNFFFLSFFFVLKYLRLMHSTGSDEINGEMPENYSVKLSDAQAVFGYHQIRKIHAVNERKAQLAAQYQQVFGSFSQLRTFYNPVYQQVRFPLVFSDAVSAAQITAIRNEALKAGFALGEWFNDVVHPIGSYRYCYNPGSCPVGERISGAIVNFPVNVNVQLTEQELQQLKNIFVRNGIV